MTLKVGLVGARGVGALKCFRAMDDTEVVAFCTLHEETLRPVVDEYDLPYGYTRFEDLLDSDVDIVYVATPVPLHVPQSVAALRAGKHVLCEIPAADSLEECWELLEAVKSAGTQYMLAENYVYMREHLIIRELVQRGYFGETYFAEGEYVHDAKGGMFDESGKPTWRYESFVGRKGANYATHALGPVLDWMGERVAQVSGFGSGRRNVPEHVMDDSTLMIGTTPSGKLIKIRNDLLSSGPPRKSFVLQGTEGAYEGNRRTVWGADGNILTQNKGQGVDVADEYHQVWLDGIHGSPAAFHPLKDFEYLLPSPLQSPPPEGIDVGHAGGDYWMARAFVDAVQSGGKPPLDIYKGLEMTAPGICAGLSIEKGGVPVDVPDFRAGT
jgi:predicted dehydrogenase